MRRLVSLKPEKGRPLPVAKESKVILYFHLLSTNQSSAISVESYLCLPTCFKQGRALPEPHLCLTRALFLLKCYSLA